MDFQLLKQIVTQIIDAIQNSAIAAVKALRETITTHTYKVEVKNLQKEVLVKGSVKVENPTDLKEVIKALQGLSAILPTLKRVTVENQIEIPKFPGIPEFPKSIEVSKIPNISFESEVSVIVDAVERVQKAVSGLKLDPQIKVSAPVIPTPIVNIPRFPAPIVNVEKPDLSSIEDMMRFWQSLTVGAKKAISVRLTDGKEFYKAVDRLVEVATSRSVSPFVTYNGTETRARVNGNGELQITSSETWDVNNEDKVSTTLTYMGEESVEGLWRVREISKSDTVTTIGYASIKNNSAILDYPTAWDDREDLEYGRASEAL